jgi:hypothetical protein
MEPTKPPVRWVPRVLSPGLKRGRRVTLTTHPILCRSRERVGARLYILHLHKCVVGVLYLYSKLRVKQNPILLIKSFHDF